MQRNYLLTLPLVFVLSVFAFLMVSTSSAKAALAGNDGKVLLIDNGTSPTLDSITPTLDATVTTMNPDGSGTATAATVTDSPVTSATISKPNTDGGNTIVYATKTQNCVDPETQSPVPCTDTTNTAGADATLNKVTIDKTGAPEAAPAPVVTLDPLIDPSDTTSTNWVSELSYSPDSTSVLAVQVAVPTNYDGPGVNGILTAVKKVTLSDGATETIVAPSRDPLLNAGYGQNGTIYFSKSDCTEDCDGSQSDIWYIPAGQPTNAPKQLTHTSDVSEYFIDASSDNKDLLVVDANSCNGYVDTHLFGISGYPGQCDYYYVSVADGSLTPLTDLNKWFVPKFFSPANDYLVGTLYPEQKIPKFFGLIKPLNTVDPAAPATAVVLRSDLANPVAISSNVGVQEWAPVQIAAVPVTTTTSPTLPATGSNLTAAMALIGLLTLVASASIVTGVVTIKK